MLRRVARVLGGHAWTVLADAKHRVRPTVLPSCKRWSLDVPDGLGADVRLSGRLLETSGAHTAVLLVHGLGGSSNSGYCRAMAEAARARGWSSLRIDLRGADGSGEDVYHAGLSADLRAAVQSPELCGYERVHVVGVSLGGHVALRLALDALPRLGAVAAISSPLDLAAACRAIDRRRALPYRHHVLRALKAAYAQLVHRHGDGPRVPSPASAVAKLGTIRDWDRLVIVPRHGFEDVADYHRRMSVGPRLGQLSCPALYVGSPFDPMVPPAAVAPALRAAEGTVRAVMLERGGHVSLPAPRLDPNAPATLSAQVMAWLDAPK